MLELLNGIQLLTRHTLHHHAEYVLDQIEVRAAQWEVRIASEPGFSNPIIDNRCDVNRCIVLQWP